MTVPRMVLLLVGLAAIGIAVVGIRVEEGRVLRRIQQYQAEETEARLELRAQDTRLWTLRAPPNIRERAAQFEPAAVAPPPRGNPNQGTTRKR